MSIVKRTYALREETLRDFEQAVESGRRSAVVESLIEEWLERQRLEALRREIIEGCQAMAEVYEETEREYHPLEEEVERGLHW